MQIPEDWRSAADAIVAASGRRAVLVVGTSDSGKTSFCTHLANRLHGAGLRTAVVDADIGQASIGPPTVIGAGFVRQPLSDLSQISLTTGAFVGSITPLRHLLPCVVGSANMVRRMLRMQAQAIVVDTTGLVHGGAGTALKLHKFELLRPTHTVLLQKENEIDHLAAQWRPVTWTELHELKTPPAARQRPREERRAYRARLFRELFAAPRGLTVSLDEVTLRCDRLYQGTPLPRESISWLGEPLGSDVEHGERQGDHVLLYTTREPYRSGIRVACGALDAASVTVIGLERFTGLLVGLLDDRGDWFSLAIVHRLELRERRLSLLVPPLPARRIRIVVCGDLRLDPGGHEIGRAELISH